MNPTPEEDIMRQRSHPSAIVLATLLACLLFATDRASADRVTVIVSANVTHVHEEVKVIGLAVSLINDQNLVVAFGWKGSTPVDRSLQEDLEIVVVQVPPFDPSGGTEGKTLMDATTYRIAVLLVGPDKSTGCEANVVYPATKPNHFPHCNAAFSKMKTYEAQEGPISDLIPE